MIIIFDLYFFIDKNNCLYLINENGLQNWDEEHFKNYFLFNV